jgi:hypothetical protein
VLDEYDAPLREQCLTASVIPFSEYNSLVSINQIPEVTPQAEVFASILLPCSLHWLVLHFSFNTFQEDKTRFMATALRTTIVSSLFPSNVRDRI